MNIRETNLRFKAQTRRRAATRKIILHHSVSGDVSAATIHQWHLDRDWHGIGYHFVIRHDGSIERGRAEETVGAHAGPTGNADSIGICLTGRFDKEKPREVQMDSLAKFIVNYLYPKYGDNLAIEGHNKYMSTECPGRHFSLIDLQGRINRLKGTSTDTQRPQESADKPEPTVNINGRRVNVPTKLERGHIHLQISGHWVQLRALVNAIPGARITRWDEPTRVAEIRIT